MEEELVAFPGREETGEDAGVGGVGIGLVREEELYVCLGVCERGGGDDEDV